MSTLISIKVRTKLGAEYLFPDVELDALSKICPYKQDGVPVGHSGQLMMINASIAVMSIPFSIIKQIDIVQGVETKVWWTSPERSDECYPVLTAKNL